MGTDTKARPDIHEGNISKIIESTDLPSRLVQVVAMQVLTVGSTSEASDDVKLSCQTLLSALRERHPSIVDSAALAVPNLDSSLVARPDGETAMLNALSADVTARVSGIQALMSPHLGQKPSGESVDGLKSTLLARLGDTEVPVLEALYRTEAHRQLILQVCSTEEIVNAVRPAFIASKLEDDVIKQHLSFVCDADLDNVLEQLLLPIALPTSHRALSEEAWNIVRSSALSRSNPIVQAVTSGDVSSASDIASRIGKLNRGSSLTIVIAKSEKITDLAISQLGSEIPSTRLLAHLVLIHTLPNDSTSAVPVAVKTLAQLRPVLSGPTMHDFEDVENPLSPKLLSAISAKPSATRTLQRATVALLAAVAKVASSNRAEVTWLSHEQSDFKRFAEGVYTWANSDILPPALAKALLRNLFMQLGEETLLFLASIWTQRSGSLVTRIAALKHAGAFIAAHKGQADGIDFQLILPSLLIALSDSAKNIREAGISAMKAISAVGTGSENVYALDNIYGVKSSKFLLLCSAIKADFRQCSAAQAARHGELPPILNFDRGKDCARPNASQDRTYRAVELEAGRK